MNDLDKAQMMAPEGEFLAYINPKEAGILKALGGSGIMTPMGIPSFMDLGPGGLDNPGPSGFGSGQSSGPSSDMSTGFDDTADVNMGLQGGMPAFTPPDSSGGEEGNNFFQTVGDLYNRFSPVTNIGRGIGNLFDMFAELRGFNLDGSPRTQQEFEDARTARQNQNRISNIMGRDAPFTQMTLNNLEGLYGEGNVPSNINESLIGTTNTTRSGTTDDFYPDRVQGIVSQAPEEYRFTDAMANLNLERGVPRDEVFLTEAQKNYIDQNKTISSEDLGTVQQNIKDATGYDSELAKTFGLEELLASGAAKKGVAFGYNLTDKGKALERFRKDATGMNNPSNPNMPYKGLGVQSQLNQLLKNENTNAMKNKNYIQEQINKGFLQNKEDFINQETLGKYL